MSNDATKVPLTGWRLGLDRALPVLAVLVLVLSLISLFGDEPATWLPLIVAGLVLAGVGTRWLLERYRSHLH